MTESVENRPLRKLLPAAEKPGVLGPRRFTYPVKPAHTTAACDNCRKHKTKCSGERPTCRRCAQRRFSCHYAARPGETESQALRRGYRELRDHAREHEEVVALLRSLPEQDAQGVFQRIRAGTGLGTILRQVRAGDALLQMAVPRETSFRYSFPYLEPVFYETASLLAAAPRPPRNEEPAQSLGGDGGGGARQPLARVRQQRSKDNDSSAAAKHNAENDGVCLSPLHAERVLKPRLTGVQIAPLMRVCDDEPLMRDLLEMSLRCEYQSKSAFQKDTFFQNLVAGRVEVLLVHAGDSNSFLCFGKSSHGFEQNLDLFSTAYDVGVPSQAAEARRVLVLREVGVPLLRRGQTPVGAGCARATH
ncbi:hypothetical protein MY10362_008942 [Beauveria mimosiformis]